MRRIKQPKNARPQVEYVKDNVVNGMSRLGTRHDKHTQTTGGSWSGGWNRKQVDAQYYGGSLIRRVVDRPVLDALKRGFEVRTGDAELDEYIADEFQRLDVHVHLERALTWARQYGGAGIVKVRKVDDVRMLQSPEGNEPISFLRVHDRWRIAAGPIEQNYASPYWNQPQHYTVGNGARILHPSHVVKIIGNQVDEENASRYSYWGQGVPESVWPSYMNLAVCASTLATMMHDAVFNVIKLKNLPALFTRADGSEGLERFDLRIKAIMEGRSALRATVLDADNEAFETISPDLSKLIESFDVFGQMFSADAEFPLMLLFGQSPQGFSSNDETSLDVYYDMVEGKLQARRLTPAIVDLARAVCSQRNIKPKTIDVYWPPVQKPDELQKAQIRLATVQADAVLVGIGAMDALEARARHADAEFASEMALQEKTLLELESAVESGLAAPVEPNPLAPAEQTQPAPNQAPPALNQDALATGKKTMIALYPPEPWLARFREYFPDADPATHLTLFYAGALNDHELLDLVEQLDRDLTGLDLNPIEMIVAGHGCFYRGGKYCEHLTMQAPIPLLALRSRVEIAAAPVAQVQQFPFLAHVTVAYRDEPFATRPVEATDFPRWRVDAIHVVQNDKTVWSKSLW